MKVPTISAIPSPSALLSSAHNAYDNLSITITNMAAPLDHEEELWPQFEVTAKSVTDGFKKYAKFEVPSSLWGSRDTPMMKVRGERSSTYFEVR